MDRGLSAFPPVDLGGQSLQGTGFQIFSQNTSSSFNAGHPTANYDTSRSMLFNSFPAPYGRFELFFEFLEFTSYEVTQSIMMSTHFQVFFPGEDFFNLHESNFHESNLQVALMKIGKVPTRKKNLKMSGHHN